MASFQDYLNVLRSNTRYERVKIEWLRSDDSVESIYIGDLLGGSLSINRNNGVRRAVSLELKNEDNLLPNVYGIWVKRKFRLWLGYNIPSLNEDYFIEQGVFVMRNPQYSSLPEGSTVTLNGADKFVLLNGEIGGELEDIYEITNGTNVNLAVGLILPEFGDNITPLMSLTTQTFPYTVRKDYGKTIGDMLKDIAYFSSRNIFYDETGRFNFIDDVDDEVKGSLWDFNYGDDLYSLLELGVENKFDEVKNYVKIICQNVNGTTVIGEASNEDPNTGTEISRIGRLPYIDTNSYIDNVTDANNLCEYILKRTKVMASQITIRCMKMFHLDVDKVITITNNAMKYDRKRVLINQINIDLSVGGEMTLVCVDTDEVDFTVGRVD